MSETGATSVREDTVPKLDNKLTWFSHHVSFIGGAAMILIALMLTAEVVMRKLWTRPIPGVAELAALVLAWVVFLPQAYTFATGNHVQVTLITMRMPPKLQLACEIFTGLFGLTIIGLLTYQSAQFFWGSLIAKEYMPSMVKWPWWAGKLAMPVGLILFSVTYLSMIALGIYKAVTGRKARVTSKYNASVGGV